MGAARKVTLHGNPGRVPGLTEEERLELAALTAPVLRREDDAAVKAKRRRVHVVKADDPTWTPIGEANGAGVLRGLVKLQELEHAVTEETRPEEVACVRCRRISKVKPVGKIQKLCTNCRNPQCKECGVPLAKESGSRGSQWCVRCYKRRGGPRELESFRAHQRSRATEKRQRQVEAIRLRESGLTLKQIAEALGYAQPTTVCKLLRWKQPP